MGELKKVVETLTCGLTVPTAFLVLPYFHLCLNNSIHIETQDRINTAKQKDGLTSFFMMNVLEAHSFKMIFYKDIICEKRIIIDHQHREMQLPLYWLNSDVCLTFNCPQSREIKALQEIEENQNVSTYKYLYRIRQSLHLSQVVY